MLDLAAHPHAEAVLGAALKDSPAHAYLLHGPAGSGKREVARAFAGQLLAKGAKDPSERQGACRTWQPPRLDLGHPLRRARDAPQGRLRTRSSGRRRTRRSRPSHRTSVLERVDVMNDEAANALLKTLEEPPSYVVLLLLTNRPTQVLPMIASRCQAVRFDPSDHDASSHRDSSTRVSRRTPPRRPRGSAWGDGEKAIRLAVPATGWSSRQAAERRTPVRRSTARSARSRGGSILLARAKQAGAGREVRGGQQQLKEELQFLPKKEHKRRETEFTERARRADRRAATQALDHALQLVGLWYRDLTVSQADRAGAERPPL